MPRTPAPPLHCAACKRRIGRRATHFLIGTPGAEQVVCGRCLYDRALRARFYPDCADVWHDLFDHGLSHASRAGAVRVLDSRER